MGSASDWLIATNNSMGMIAFAMVMMMINMDMWRVDSHPRSWVRWMVYFDATAFTVLYAYQLTADLFHTCQQVNAILLLAEFIWSIKDAFKYGFIIHKSLLINNMHMKWPPYAAAATSLVFYWVYMLQYYGFGEGCIPPLPGNWALVGLYITWTTVDFTATVAMVTKISKVMVASEQLASGMGHEGTQKQMETEVQIFGIYKLREEVRLLICVGGMGGISALAVIRVLRPDWGIPAVNKIIFVFVQLLLLLGSRKVDALTSSRIEKSVIRRMSVDKEKDKSSADIEPDIKQSATLKVVAHTVGILRTNSRRGTLPMVVGREESWSGKEPSSNQNSSTKPE